MDTRFLETFVTVVDGGSIAEAARRLHLSPAAVAQRIGALEDEIGTRLLSRSGRNMKPTKAGAAILGRARNFLGELRDLKSLAANDELSGELRVGAFPTAICGLLPDILIAMKSDYPQIKVSIMRGASWDLSPRVLASDLDGAIIAQPPFAIPKICDWRVLRQEPLVVLTPAAMPARHPHAILASEPFIRVERSTWQGQLVDGYLRRARIRPIELFELDDLHAVARMVDRNLGVALVPDWAPPWPEGLSLRKLPVPDGSFSRYVGLVWNKASLRLRLIQAFLEVAVTVVARERLDAPKYARKRPLRRR
jgi:DNA-binding transcriptional LysR family regulator